MRNGLIRLSRAALCVAACFGGVAASSSTAAAAPTLPKVVAGQATFNQDGSVFSITNTPGTIINWQGFSVDAGEITRFIQQSSDSAVLNRIVGQDPSRILGALQSNGKVFLINPNGVVFGQGARVDVNSLVASTLDMSDADFLAGKKQFTAAPNAGNVRNEGAITTPGGGKVFLVAPNVENSGVITAPNGEVVLAAGRSVQLVDSSNPDLSVVVSAPGDQAINLGQVVANGGRIGIYGALVNQRGVVNANSAVRGQDGRIVLKASKEAVLETGSATGAGSIDLRANERIVLASGSQLSSPDVIDLHANQMTLAGNIGGVGGVAPVVSFNTFDRGREILVRGSGPSTSLVLDPARLGAFDAFGINIGNSAHAAPVTIDGALTLAGYLAIDTGGSININAPVRLTGPNSQFIGTLHQPLGSAAMVSSMGSIEAAKKISLLGADQVQVHGAMVAGDIDINAGSGGIQLRRNPNTTGTASTNLVANGTLSLRTAGQLLQESASNVRAPRLLVEGAMVQMLGANQVGTLAGKATGAETGNLQFRYTGDLKIGSVAGVSGLVAPVELSLTGGAIGVDANIEGRAVTIKADAIRAGAGLVKASSMLFLESNNGIGASGAPLRTSATVLNASNTLEGSGNAPISIQNDRALTIGNVVQAGSGNAGAIAIESTGGLTVAATSEGQAGVKTGSGDISLVTHSPLTILGKVSTVSGNVTLLADNKGALTIGPGGQVASASGNVSLTGGSVSYPADSVVAAPGKLAVTKTDTPVQQPEPTPPGLNVCLTSPNTAGCGNVIEQATRSCISNPDAPGCAAVLPPVDACRADPGRLGCAVVIQRDEIRQCIANPKAPGCGSTLPPYDICEKTPATYGCAPVISQREAIAQCIANPKGAGCATTLPPYDSCAASPSTFGCAPVIAERNAITACMATPKAPACSATLPTYDACVAAPNTYGCAPVVAERDAITACIATPKAPSCAATLPTYDFCAAAPGTYGCAPVMAERAAVAACIATPTAPGCADTLPPLAACRLDAGVFGCAPVIARAEFLACVANPSGAGCAQRLPALALCKATPGVEGCAQVLQVSFNACLLNKNDPACAGILPTLSQCEANKSLAGCAVVLPSLQQCIGSPTLQGCTVMLPKLEQCAVNPSLQGCEAVLPKPDFCSTHPTDPACIVFNPAPTQGGGESKTPVASVQQNTVNLINTRTPAQEKLPAATPPAGTAAGGTGGSNSSSNSGGEGGAGGSTKPAEQPDSQSGPAAGTNTGVKNEKPATKMYCN